MKQARRHGWYSGSVPRNHSLCPPKQEFCPPSKDCAPKKVTGSAPMKCSSRPQNPKLLVITPKFESKSCFFRIICNKDIFLVFNLEFVEIPTYFAIKIFGCWFTLSNLKVKVFCPSLPVSQLWRRAWSEDEERWSVEEQIEWSDILDRMV